ncbi:MAG TPA: S-methyl-5'-thioadenosine phosphorylase [Thermoanaerobaculia bacterium]|nr:S-methyl-5'-thioadenosine phosphorylase [Thermoanaerobaculia bacterium]
MSDPRLGVIGGTGLYGMEELRKVEERWVDTPFGRPSDAYVLGELEGTPVAFLPRHGRDHRLLPSELNYRANVFGFRKLGVTHLVSVSAVGSLREPYEPGQVVVVDQFFDRTRHRPDTFFGNGLVAHVSFAHPTCPGLSAVALEALRRIDAKHHAGGTYLCMEGPQFSTKAESVVYRQWGADVIGMTNLQEAKLAREAEMCFICLALVTDWDCWKEDVESVTVEGVLEVLKRNTSTAQNTLREIARLGAASSGSACGCRDALRGALVTDLALVPHDTLEALDPLIGRYRR